MIKGKLLYCHAPPTYTSEEATAYNAVIYQPGGSKHIPADATAHGSAQATNPSLTADAVSSIAANTGRLTVSQVVRDFFADRTRGGNAVLARTVGRFQDTDFRRVNVYPHQSGYVLAPDGHGGDGGASSVGGSAAPSVVASMAARMADGARGKKSHKTGKRRLKDRSWRAE
jgi:hypothetical protein